MTEKHITGRVVQGYQVASGLTADRRFPQGSIALQKPYFKKLGLDLDWCFNGTINLTIKPSKVRLLIPDYSFSNVKWTDAMPAETFSFIKCSILFNQTTYTAYLYYPHPESKIDHFQGDDVIEILTEKISGLHYNSKLTLIYDTAKLQLLE